jgi:LEA14-like dessication related protein
VEGGAERRRHLGPDQLHSVPASPEVIAKELVMPIGRSALLVMFAFGAFLFGGCASVPQREPLQVIVVGVEPLQGEGLEVRMLVRLRIQNPNDSQLDFNGVSVQLDFQGKPFATGVSNAAGSLPRFGETIVSVPVSISVFRIARQAIGVLGNEFRGKLVFGVTGKLAGPEFNSVSFRSKGEFMLPPEIFK